MTLQIYRIASTTVTSSTATDITFSNIPQGYRDLKLVVSGRTNLAGSTTASGGMYINSLSTDNSYRYLVGNGSTVGSGNNSSQADFYFGELDGASATANTFSNSEIYIPNYTSSNQKSFSADSVAENNGTACNLQIGAGLSTKTAAVTSITIRGFGGSGSGSLVQNTTAILYGIL